MKRAKRIKGHYPFLAILLFLIVLISAGCNTEEYHKAAENHETEEYHEAEENLETEENHETAEDTDSLLQDIEPQQDEAKEQEIEGMTFPVKLDNDRLEIASVFEYSGINPDCANEYSESIGAIQLQNISGQYLKSAEISVELSDGSYLKFLVEDIPAEVSVLAYELQNLGYDGSHKVVNINAETVFEENQDSQEVSYSIEGTDITVANTGATDMVNVTLQYHCSIEGIYFGGRSYELTLAELKAGENRVVSAVECYLGDVAVAGVNY